MIKTADLGRAGAGLESEMAKRERLKYYEEGFINGYKLAMQDVATLVDGSKHDAKRRYVDQGIVDIQIGYSDKNRGEEV